MRRIVCSILVSLSIVGCLDEPGTGSGDNDGPDAIEVDFDPTTPDGPVTPVEPGEPGPQALTWCAPTAVPYDVGQIPTPPEGFDDETFCEAATVAPADAVATRVYRWSEESRVLRVESTAPVGPDDVLVTFTFDEADRVREVYRQGGLGWYGAGVGTTDYVLNELGELEHKVSARTLDIDFGEGQPTEVVETVQQWDGARLLSREVRQGEDGPAVQTYTWEYDDGGRLVRARLTDASQPDATRTYEASWSYHDAGQPASVERTVDGVLVERESWEFDAEGQLTARTFEGASSQQLAAQHGGQPWDWQLAPGLDAYQRRSDDAFIDNPWRDALPVQAGDCWMLPHGPGHGYPDGEAEYQLGVPSEERPGGIGFAYGNDSYGWYYGDLAWYGHDGLGTSWLGRPLSGDAAGVEVEVRYEGGRMTSESATITSGLAGDEPVTLERARTFEGGRLVSDRVSSGDATAAPARLLRFERDEHGYLSGRELMIGEEVVGRQSWERDAEGRALRHTIEMTETRSTELPEPWEQWLVGFGRSGGATAEWTWRYDGDRLVERGGGQTELHEARVYDDLGRLIEVIGTFLALDYEGSQRLSYDDRDRVTERCTSWDRLTWTCLGVVFDEAGRVAWRESWQNDDDPVVVELNEYRCDP